MRLPPETFRVRPIPHSPRFFVVHVAPTLRSMRATIKRLNGDVHPRQLACCISASARGSHRHLLGFLFFSTECLGYGLVAHEMSHAAFRTCERLGIRVEHWESHAGNASLRRQTHGTRQSAAPEERYCTIAERLNRMFWVEYFKRDWS